MQKIGQVMGSNFHGNSIPVKKLENTSKLAEAFTKEQIVIVLDELENALLIDGEVKYNRQIADRVIGQRLALAYAMGALDRTENRSVSKIVLS